MSSWLVTKTHIDVLATAASRWDQFDTIPNLFFNPFAIGGPAAILAYPGGRTVNGPGWRGYEDTLGERGGDFQGASFTADTVVRIERVGYRNGARYIHVFEREIRDLYDCAGLADADCYVCDFMAEEVL